MSYTSALFTSARYSTTREERDPAFRVLTNATINKNVLEVSFTLFGALSPPRPVTSIYFARSEAAFLADSSTSLTLLRVHRLNTLCEERFPYALKSFARFSRPRARMRVFLSTPSLAATSATPSNSTRSLSPSSARCVCHFSPYQAVGGSRKTKQEEVGERIARRECEKAFFFAR
jgi:hypothetical protein